MLLALITGVLGVSGRGHRTGLANLVKGMSLTAAIAVAATTAAAADNNCSRNNHCISNNNNNRSGKSSSNTNNTSVFFYLNAYLAAGKFVGPLLLLLRAVQLWALGLRTLHLQSVGLKIEFIIRRIQMFIYISSLIIPDSPCTCRWRTD